MRLRDSIWRLFRRDTASLIAEVLQPALDSLELPNYIQSVKIQSLTLGSRSPLVRNIVRLPSRARSELQYRFNSRLVGDMKIDLLVKIHIPFIRGRFVEVPVTVTDLDIDAQVWLGFQLMPNPPWVRFVQWSLQKLPDVSLSLTVGNTLPLSGIPVLSTVLDRIFTKLLPREFLFPKAQLIDLAEGKVSAVSGGHTPVPNPFMVYSQGRTDNGSEENATQDLRSQNPALWALFDSMDDKRDGKLSCNEVVRGLSEDWGFSSTSEEDKVAMFKILDKNNTGSVTFGEFIEVWPDLRQSFVPRRYEGVVSGILLRAESLPTPRWGVSDPFVMLRLEKLEVSSRKNYETSQQGDAPGDAIWNEGWELEVESPGAAWLTLEVREGSPFAFYGRMDGFAGQLPGVAGFSAMASDTSSDVDASRPENGDKDSSRGRILCTGRVRVQSLMGSDSKRMWVPMEPGGGQVLLELSYAEYVDARPI